MTDSKSWLWRKKSSEKNVDKVDITSKQNEEIHMLLAEKEELERDLRDLSDKLSTALSDCDAKDELAKKNAKAAQKTVEGWEKAETKALSLKQELDEALKEKETCEQKTCHLDAALKECMQQLRFVREDQEKRIHDVLRKASKELEGTNKFWEEKLKESDTKLAKMTGENSQLNKMLLLKEQAIEDLTRQRTKLEDHVNTLLNRLEGLEKENNSLLYEVRILEKEVDIRNEEREFNRRTADASHKHHLENVKKIAKLEGECQRLRVLVRKRLPGPAALAQMKSEVDILQFGNRRQSYPDSPGKNIDTLSDKIYTLEEENNSLREALQQQLRELQISRNMYVKTASKLSQAETQFEESPKSQIFGQMRRNSLTSHDLSLTSMSDIGSDDKASCAGSSASADGKHKKAKTSDISDMNNFMDDFAEMEKLALVCVDNPKENSSVTKSESSLTSLSEKVNGSAELPSELSKSVLEVIKGLKLSSQVSDSVQSLGEEDGIYSSHKNLETPTGYKTSDLSSVMQNFVHVCEDLLNRKTDFEVFTQELVSTLEWVINHCLNETGGVGEMQRLNDKTDSEKQELEIQSLKDECESLKNQLQITESSIENLQSELEALKHSKAMVENTSENLKMTIEDRDSQLSALTYELDEACQKLVSIEAELTKKVDYCEELDSKCMDLQLQLERSIKIDSTKHVNQDEKQLRSEQEFSAASEKLAECQETILYLGKQLRALASSRDGAMVSDKFISTPKHTNIENKKNLTGQQSSLLDKMLADEDVAIEQLESPKTKEVICPPRDFGYEPAMQYVRRNTEKKYESENAVINSLALIPSKKQHNPSGGFIMKLLRRKKKGGSKKFTRPFTV